MKNYLSRIGNGSKPAHLIILAGVFVVMFFRLIWFVDRYSVNVIFWDQWDFLTPLFNQNTTFWQLFSLQHGPHRQGLGELVLAFLYPLTSWNVRVESFIAAGLVGVSGILAIMLKKRLFGSLHWSDSAIPLAFFTLLQYETFIGTSNLAHGPIPLFLITLTAYVLTMNNQITRAAGLVVLVFFSTYTGFAIFSAIPVIFLLFVFSVKSKTIWLRLFNIVALLLAIAAFGSFFLNYHLAAAVDCYHFPHEKPLDYVWFSFLQFGSALGANFLHHFPILNRAIMLYSFISFLLLIAMFVISTLLIIISQDEKPNVIFYLASFTLLFIGFTSIGRVCLGLEAAFASRYITHALPGILALYFGILAGIKYFKTRKWISLTVISVALFLLFIKEGNVFFSKGIGWYSEGKRKWVNCYLEKHTFGECDSVANFKIYPDSNSIVKKLDYLEKNNLSFFNESQR